ncbi:MAG: 3-hydroxyacyl-ACP dehydratase FabZ [Bacilli bacterium]
MSKLNREQIKNIIPHRYEMLLIDEVEIISETVAKGTVYLDDSKWFFAGHFPNEPVMPGVLQVEAAAQVGATALLSKAENKGKIGYFTGIDKVKFRKKMMPNDELHITVTFIKMKMGIGKGEVNAVNKDGDKVFSALITFTVM